MQKDELRIVGFYSENASTEQVRNVEERHGAEFYLLPKSDRLNPLKQLDHLLQEITGNPLLLVLDLDYVMVSGSLNKAFTDLNAGPEKVMFAASPYFRFDHPGLHYFYWKHYPRHHRMYNYLDASAFSGRKKMVQAMLEAIQNRYPDEAQRINVTLNDLASRFYADTENHCFQPAVRIVLDHENKVFTCTRLSVSSVSRKNWIYNLLHFRNEKHLFEHAGLTEALEKPLQVELDENFYNISTKTHPVVVSFAPDGTGQQEYLRRREAQLSVGERFRLNRVALKAKYETLRQLFHIRKVNKGNLKAERIFRYVPNKNKELNEATQQIISRLESQQPVSFAHYNDGELTFIRDYLDDKNHEKWFGRKQQQYNPLLAERLHDAMKFQKEGYFVGVPCSVHHPKLRKLADEIVGTNPYKVPAMTLHHNLALMPRLLYSLRNRDVFFFTNEYQDLSFFELLGIKVDPDRVYKVPFRNSYLQYDTYKDLIFPKNAVVILTCGMLAKILTKAWYEKYDDLSVLALGSSLDDHVQKENIDFELYPTDLPLTKNIHKSRAFLFGYKKTCRECFCY